MAARALLSFRLSTATSSVNVVPSRFRSTKGSYRVRNRTKATKLQHLRNRELREQREQAHRDRMIMQRKEAVERRVDRDMRKKAFEEERAAGLQTSTVIKVVNLPFDVDEAKLASLYQAYNPVKAVIARTKAAGQSRGFGFVQLPDINSAEIAAAQTLEVDSRVVKAHRTHKTHWVE